jgi:hypothetical protein
MGLITAERGAASIGFLGRTYRIAKDGISLTDSLVPWTVGSEGFEHNLKSVLGYYLLSGFNGEPMNDFCLLSHFAHGVFDNRPAWDDPLVPVYGDEPEKLGRVGEALGFLPEAAGRWHYALFPKMPVKIVYYEGDDEYPPNIPVLFDKTAIQVYKFEPLAVLYGCFRHALAAVGNVIP